MRLLGGIMGGGCAVVALATALFVLFAEWKNPNKPK